MAQESGRDPQAVDVAMGSRVRHRRRVFDITQQALAEVVGATFQRFSRLLAITRVLRGRLYELTRREATETEGSSDRMKALLSRDGALELLEAYAATPPELRRPLLQLVRELAQGGAKDPCPG